MSRRSSEPKYRRPLNQVQVELLELLYKFRFITVATMKDYFSESYPGMNVFKRLETLVQQNLLAKRYFDNYRLLHKPVAYYLLPHGARTLMQYREEDDTELINIKTIYRDCTLSERYVMHCIAVFNLYNQLIDLYGEELTFLSKSDLFGLNDLPNPLPDAYVELREDNSTKCFFVDILDDDVHLMADASKKFKNIISYRKSGKWDTSESEFPTIVFVCSSEEASERVRKRCEGALNKAWIWDIVFITKTIDWVKLD